MKSSFKNTIISLFKRIDKAIFDVHRKGRAWKNRKVPHWAVLILALGLYSFLIWQLWPFLSATEISFFRYFGSFMMLAFTVLFLVFAKIYISQLIDYKSPYRIHNEKTGSNANHGRPDIPFHFSKMAHRLDHEHTGLFQDYLRTDREDYKNLLAGRPVSKKLVWLPLTDRKLPNFRLFFELLNHISDENLEGYYGQNLVSLCNYIVLNFKSENSEWSLKQLQKAHSGWKNCNPKRRMDLKIDIENHLKPVGRP